MEFIWLDFLNSDYHDWRGGDRSEDRLQNPAWWEWLHDRWRLSAPLPSDAELGQLRALRAVLARIATAAAAGEPPDEADLSALNNELAARPAVPMLGCADGRYTLQRTIQATGLARLRGEVAHAFADTLVHGDPGRIGYCDNPDCRWWFYDDTRNRSKRFCDVTACGNLMKVRRFRERQKAGREKS